MEKQVRQALRDPESGATRPGVIHDLACDKSYHEGHAKDIESEAVETILGGSEAIAHVLLHCTIMLVRYPEQLRRLREDFATHGVDPVQCSHGTLTEIPYLVTFDEMLCQKQN